MITPCPKCHRKLKVPDGTVGRRARCPACKQKFVIADPQDESFETIAGYAIDPAAVRTAGRNPQAAEP